MNVSELKKKSTTFTAYRKIQNATKKYKPFYHLELDTIFLWGEEDLMLFLDLLEKQIGAP